MKKAIEYIIRAKDATGSGLKSAMGRIKSFAANIGRNLANIQSGIQMAMGAVQKFASVFTKSIGEAFKFEKATSDFKVLLGSIDKAKEHMADLRSFAASTPLTFEDLSKSSKLLLSFGASVDEVMPAMKMLGDIAMGDAQKFQGLSLVFAQVKSAGKLMGQDLLQMINQGFNPLTIIAQQTGKSMSELKDMMGEGKISFEMVAEAMRIATSEGGLFNNAMGEAAKTGEGMVSTLQDNWTEAVRTFGEAFSDSAKSGVGLLSQKLQELTEDGTIELWATKVADALTRIKEGAMTVIGPLGKVLSFGWKAIQGSVRSQALAIGNAAGTLYGGGNLWDAIKAGGRGWKQGWVDAFDMDGAQKAYDESIKENARNKRKKKKSVAPVSETPAKTLDEMMAEAEAEEKAKAEAEAAKKAKKKAEAARKAAEAEEKERLRIEAAIAKERERLRKAEMKAYERELTKAHQTAQEKAAAAQDRLSAAQEKSRQAWGWYRDKDSLAAQIDEERAEAAAQKQFDKDFEKLKSKHRDWRTAAAYGSGAMRSLSLDEEAVRRVALAREEEVAAKEYARQTAEECTRAADALEAIQNTICTEG
jgi:tape measure domain-containing protein